MSSVIKAIPSRVVQDDFNVDYRFKTAHDCADEKRVERWSLKVSHDAVSNDVLARHVQEGTSLKRIDYLMPIEADQSQFERKVQRLRQKRAEKALQKNKENVLVSQPLIILKEVSYWTAGESFKGALVSCKSLSAKFKQTELHVYKGLIDRLRTVINCPDFDDVFMKSRIFLSPRRVSETQEYKAYAVQICRLLFLGDFSRGIQLKDLMRFEKAYPHLSYFDWLPFCGRVTKRPHLSKLGRRMMGLSYLRYKKAPLDVPEASLAKVAAIKLTPRLIASIRAAYIFYNDLYWGRDSVLTQPPSRFVF